jgi:Ala-tRNA(Pro) deacylase
MATLVKLKEYLNKESVSYETMEHSLAYTASEVAGTKHIPGKQMAKTVIVKADDQFIMCVVPASFNIDFDKLKTVLEVQNVQLAKESDLAKLFPEDELGAEPPFGNWYGMKLLVDKNLQDNQNIAFNAGTHTDLCRIKVQDFLRLAKPIIAEFGIPLDA